MDNGMGGVLIICFGSGLWLFLRTNLRCAVWINAMSGYPRPRRYSCCHD